MGHFKALRNLLLEWQSVTVTLLPIPEGVTITADHCNCFAQRLPPYLPQGYFGPRMMMFCDGRWGQMLRAQGGKVCSFSHSNSVMSVSAARNGRHSPLLRLVVGLWLDLEKRELRFVHFVFSNYVCSPTLLLLRNLITKPVSSPSNSNQMGREALEGFRVSQKPAASRKIYKHPVIHNLKSMVC